MKLIDADNLKAFIGDERATLHNEQQTFKAMSEIEFNTRDYMLSNFQYIIDNAPTVEEHPTTCPNCDSGYAQGYSDGYLQGKEERPVGEWNNHKVACLLAELFGDNCACNYCGIDEWLPQNCDFASKECPDVVGVACWEQFLKHREKMKGAEG